MANLQHLQVYANENRTLTLYARDSANAPADLTGKSISWSVGSSPWDPESANATFTKVGTVVSAPAGSFTVAIVPTDTQYLNGDYEHVATTQDNVTGATAVVCRGRFRVDSVLRP